MSLSNNSTKRRDNKKIDAANRLDELQQVHTDEENQANVVAAKVSAEATAKLITTTTTTTVPKKGRVLKKRNRRDDDDDDDRSTLQQEKVSNRVVLTETKKKRNQTTINTNTDDDDDDDNNNNSNSNDDNDETKILARFESEKIFYVECLKEFRIAPQSLTVWGDTVKTMFYAFALGCIYGCSSDCAINRPEKFLPQSCARALMHRIIQCTTLCDHTTANATFIVVTDDFTKVVEKFDNANLDAVVGVFGNMDFYDQMFTALVLSCMKHCSKQCGIHRPEKFGIVLNVGQTVQLLQFTTRFMKRVYNFVYNYATSNE